jgi:hypothetical protein
METTFVALIAYAVFGLTAWAFFSSTPGTLFGSSAAGVATFVACGGGTI